MFSISEVEKRTDISSYTLRYYEKMGLLPPSKRKAGGQRMYTEDDVRFIMFIKSLKQTGMSLEDIKEFVKDGCILERIHSDIETSQLTPSINRRIEILTKHLENMEIKKKELDEIISTTKLKLNTYYSILKRDEEKK